MKDYVRKVRSGHAEPVLYTSQKPCIDSATFPILVLWNRRRGGLRDKKRCNTGQLHIIIWLVYYVCGRGEKFKFSSCRKRGKKSENRERSKNVWATTYPKFRSVKPPLVCVIAIFVILINGPYVDYFALLSTQTKPCL